MLLPEGGEKVKDMVKDKMKEKVMGTKVEVVSKRVKEDIPGLRDCIVAG